MGSYSTILFLFSSYFLLLVHPNSLSFLTFFLASPLFRGIGVVVLCFSLEDHRSHPGSDISQPLLPRAFMTYERKGEQVVQPRCSVFASREERGAHMREITECKQATKHSGIILEKFVSPIYRGI